MSDMSYFHEGFRRRHRPEYQSRLLKMLMRRAGQRGSTGRQPAFWQPVILSYLLKK